MSVEFKEVFAEELEAVNFRRRLVQDGTVARERAEAAARLAAESGTAAPASKPQRAAYAVTRVDAELDQESAGANGTTPTTRGAICQASRCPAAVFDQPRSRWGCCRRSTRWPTKISRR